MDIKTHVNAMASALGKLSTAHGNTVKTLSTFINEASLGDELIKNYLDQVAEQAIAKKVSKASASVYKSQIKKILNIAAKDKKSVLEKATEAGNLDQWYKACLDNAPAQRNKNPKVNKPKATSNEPKEAEMPEVETVNDPIETFKTSVQTMLEVGMTVEQIHAMVDSLAGVKKAA
jgi:site-specific recombinase XerD